MNKSKLNKLLLNYLRNNTEIDLDDETLTWSESVGDVCLIQDMSQLVDDNNPYYDKLSSIDVQDYIDKYFSKISKAYYKMLDIADNMDNLCNERDKRYYGKYVMNNYRWHNLLNSKKQKLEDAIDNYSDAVDSY